MFGRLRLFFNVQRSVGAMIVSLLVYVVPLCVLTSACVTGQMQCMRAYEDE